MSEQLKKAGLRLTPQRIAIMKFLEGNTSHPPAEEIYKALRPEFPSLSLATVYNTLQALSEAGIVQEINIDPGKRHFDPNPVPHCHFYCHQCKRIFDVDLDLHPVEGLGRLGDFRVEKYYVNLMGRCPLCNSEED